MAQSFLPTALHILFITCRHLCPSSLEAVYLKLDLSTALIPSTA